MVLHRVADYAAWRQVYESVADLQKAGGVTSESVHRMAGDPDNVLVVHEFETVDEARSFFGGPELRQGDEARRRPGPPRIEFYE